MSETPQASTAAGRWHSFPAVRRIEIVVYAVAFIARMTWALLVDAKQVSDATWYHTTAEMIARGGGYVFEGRPTAYWPVGYSAVLGGLYAVVGASPLAGRALNAVFSFGALFFTSKLATRIHSPRVGLATAVLLALYPADLAYCAVLLSEPLFSCLMMAGCYAAVFATRRSAIVAGVLFGLGTLTRNQGAALPFLVLSAALVGTSREWKRHVGQFAVIVGCLALVVAPWTIRNWVALDRFVPVSTNGGINFYIGNNPRANAGTSSTRPSPPR